MLGETITTLRKQRGMTQQSLADALDITVQDLLGKSEETIAAPSDIAAALSRINDQLAIQNRRRSRIWKIVDWVIGVYVAFNILLLALGYAYTAQIGGEVVTTDEIVIIAE